MARHDYGSFDCAQDATENARSLHFGRDDSEWVLSRAPGFFWRDYLTGHGAVPVLGQVFPFRVQAFDQPELFLSAPALELLFTINGVGYVIETFPVDESSSVVGGGESIRFLRFVLEDAAMEVVRHADIQRAA
jgi:hypothetical protein